MLSIKGHFKIKTQIWKRRNPKVDNLSLKLIRQQIKLIHCFIQIGNSI